MPLPAFIAALPLFSKIVGGTALTGLGVGAVRAATGTSLHKDEEDDVGLDPNRSAFTRLLEFAGQTSQPVLNLFGGRFDSAARHTGDLVGKTVDAFLPGDVIPDLARKSDFTSTSELVGMEDAPFLARLPVDIVGDVLTSPLSLLSAGGKGAATIVRKGVEESTRAGEAALRGSAAQIAKRNALAKGAGDLTGRKLASATDEVLGSITAAERQSLVTQRAKGFLQGEDGIRALIAAGANKAGLKAGLDDVVNEVMTKAGGDVAEVQRLIGPGGEMAQFFRQGGTTFAGHQLLREGAVMQAAARAAGTLGRVAGGARGEAVAAKGLEKTLDGLAAIRRATGNLMLSPVTAMARRMRGGKAAQVAQTQIAKSVDMLQHLPDEQRTALWDVFQNVTEDAASGFRVLADDLRPNQAFESVNAQVQRLTARAKRHPALQSVDQADLENTIRGIVDLNSQQFAEMVREGVIRKPQAWMDEAGNITSQDELLANFISSGKGLDDASQKILGRITDQEKRIADLTTRIDEANIAVNAGRATALGDDLKKLQNLRDDLADELDDLDQALAKHGDFHDWAETQGWQLRDVPVHELTPVDYMQRIFRAGTQELDDTSDIIGRPSVSRSRSIREPEDLARRLNAGDLDVERDALRVLVNRAEGQGRAISRAQAIRQVMGDNAVANDRAVREGFNAAIEELRRTDPDLAHVLMTDVQGIPHRGFLMQRLNDVNRYWKPGTLYGIGVPKVAAMSKNRFGALWQEFSTEGTVSSASRLASDFKGMFSDMASALVGKPMFRDEMGRVLDGIDEAVRAAGGDARRIGQHLDNVLDPELARYVKEAMDSGIMEGFADTELLLKQWRAFRKRRLVKEGGRLRSFLDMPGKMFNGVEHRLRLGQFIDLRKKGVPPAKAQQLVQDAYLDYTVAGVGDRAMRDIIPFGAFLTRSIPQQAGFLARRPGVAVGLESVFGDNEDVVLPPFLQDQASVPTGLTDREGNPIVIGSTGLPVEVLDIFPGSTNPRELSESLRKGVVASFGPIPKALATLGAGRDPFFDQPIGSDNRAPKALQLFGASERGTAGRIFRQAEDLGITAPFTSTIDQLDRLTDERSGLGQTALNLLTGFRAHGVDENRALQQQLQSELQTNPRVRTFTSLFQPDGEGDPETQRLLDLLRQTRRRIANR